MVDQPGMGTLLGADEYLVKPVEKALSWLLFNAAPAFARPRSERDPSWSLRMTSPAASSSLKC